MLRRLLADADVLIQNFRPGALEKLGFGYEDVRKFNDRIVYVSISGFGQDGPRSGQRVYDTVIQAFDMMAEDNSNREIADATGIKIHTVRRWRLDPDHFCPYLDEVALKRALEGSRSL